MKEFGILRVNEKGRVAQNDTAINRICSFDEADINLQKALVKLSKKKVGTSTTQPPAQAGQSTDPTKTTLLAGSKGNGCPLPPLIIFSKATYGPDIAANMPMLRDHEGDRCIKSLAYGNDSGGMTHELFKMWLQMVIATYTPEDLEKGVIILCDGVATHILPDLLDMHCEKRLEGPSPASHPVHNSLHARRGCHHICCLEGRPSRWGVWQGHCPIHRGTR